jgi:uncharacterized membrane protein YphA (DoxX/SURF4 family)
MENILREKTLRNAELILRCTMSITLLVAGISKFYSHGNFYSYYSKEFANKELRINLPAWSFETYLTLIPYLEVTIGLALLTMLNRRLFIVIWIIYFISLEIGHYLLEQFQSANMIIPYIIMGVMAYILPGYNSYWKKRFDVKVINQ